MAALDAGVFNSKLFVFVVGDSKQNIPVHAAIIAKQSKALDVLINGGMAEASDGKAIFEDVQEDTFVRFCQFAYTGNYTTPQFTENPDIAPSIAISHDHSIIDHGNSRPIEDSSDSELDFNDSWRFAAKKPKTSTYPVIKLPIKPSKSHILRQSLDDQLYVTEESHISSTAGCEVRYNSSPTEDYTTVFLGHAQLYVFAEKWGIKDLKTLALSKLHRTLTSFTLYAPRRPDIVELLRYTFSNDNTPDLVDAVDDLRSLVMPYTACVVEDLMLCPEFVSLIGECGQFAQHLVQMLMKRID